MDYYSSTYNSISSSTQAMAIDVLRSMRLQESGSYKIPTSHLESILQISSCSSSSSGTCCPPSPGSQDPAQAEDDPSEKYGEKMNPDELTAYLGWRRQMIEWSYRIAETCKFSKETIEIATSILDRYVATNPLIMLDSGCYQLSCMACLYTACKMNEPTCLSPKQMEKISGCRFDNQALQVAEVTILTALQWRVNPPTAIAFARNLLNSQNLQDDFGIPSKQQVAVLEVVEIQIEQATADELFLPIRASGIALAAVLNALRGYLPPTKLWKLETLLSSALGYELQTSYHRHQKIVKLQNALLALVAISHGYELCPPLEHEEDPLAGSDDDEVMMITDIRGRGDEKMSPYGTSSAYIDPRQKSPTDSDYFRPYSPKSVAQAAH